MQYELSSDLLEIKFVVTHISTEVLFKVIEHIRFPG